MPENLPPTLIEVRAALQTFIESEVVPLEKQYAGSGVPEEVRARIRELSKARGFYYKTQPEEYGGHPAGQLELVVLRECFAANNCHGWSMVFGPGPGILHAADGELKEHYLEPLLRGEKSGAFGFTEPGSAVRPTWAVRRGDRLTINGQKSYVTGGMEADFVSILLNVEDEKGVKEGAAMVVVDRDAPGVIVERAFQSMEGGGHVSLQFDNVEVPLSHVIGKIGEGMPRALGNIGNVRMMVASQAAGMAMWVLDFVEKHLQAPHRTGTPLGEREGVRLRYADMRIKTYAARSMLYRTARLAESGENTVNETIASKVFCTEVAGEVVDMGVQLVGGQALVLGHPLERLYREVRSMRLVEGASDLLRINLAKGKLELGKGRL